MTEERSELRILEHRVTSVLAWLPETPEEHLETTGAFWRDVELVRVSLRMLAAIRDDGEDRE